MRSFPTLLVAGLAGGNALLRPLCRFLRERGVDAACAPAPAFRAAGIGREPRRLRQTIGRRPEDAEPLTLLGYSLGGLIAVAALEEPASAAPRVRSVVTFAAPFDGVLGWPSAAFLDGVRRQLADPGRAWRLRAVNGGRDILAPFPQASVPPDDALSGDYGHLSILSDSRLHALLHELIVMP